MSSQFQNAIVSTVQTVKKKKRNCKNKIQDRRNSNQKQLKLLLTELISKMYEKPKL